MPVPALLCGDLNMLRCFSESGVPTSVAASDPDEPTLRSRYCTRSFLIAPADEPERCVGDLELIARELGDEPVLYYGTDAMLLLVARNAERLAEAFRFRTPPLELVEALVDKIQFATLAQARGIPIPETLSSSEAFSARQVVRSVPLPCVVKPSVHIGWLRGRALRQRSIQKAIVAETLAELDAVLEEVREHTRSFVVQRYVPGGEDEIHSFHAYSDARARVLGWFVGKKIRTYPMQAGVSTYLELVKEPDLARLGHEIVERLGLVGPVKIDFKRDADTGGWWVLELNPRFTLWNYLGAVSGVNLPELAYADLAGERCPLPSDYRTGVRWLSFGNDLRSFVRGYRPSGTLSTLQYLASLRGPKVYDVFSWNDPMPWVSSALRYSRAAARRWLGTAAPRGKKQDIACATPS